MYVGTKYNYVLDINKWSMREFKSWEDIKLHKITAREYELAVVNSISNYMYLCFLLK